ncbi:MAG: glycogen/starch synthase [Candidatus Krumholzibacteriales bacterium]
MNTESLNVIIATPEIVPFSKVGGLADVIGALPDELADLGCQVRIFTPLYSTIDREKFGITRMDMDSFSVSVGGRLKEAGIYSAKKPGTDIDVYFLHNTEYYDREGIYYKPENGEAYRDEPERTVFFNRAVIESIKVLDLYPDVIHCNDFHTGLIPAYIDLEEKEDSHFRSTGTLFSIHNMAYQGNYEKDFIETAGLDDSLFYPMSPFEYWGGVNVMKIGIMYAGIVTTVSETYAEEIKESEKYGHGMEGILRDEDLTVIGILNGIDTDTWSPAKDHLIEENYSIKDLSGKQKNRDALLGEYNLEAGPGTPVIGMVSRLVDQKGFDILAEGMDEIMKLDLRLVILGTGQEKFHKLYTKLQKKYPEKLGIKLEYDNRMAHLIEAGSDFFLMPSRYEPCGLNQMYSLSYGTIPIVRATGGLKDTVRNLTRGGRRGNGFIFSEYSDEALVETIGKAVDFFQDKEAVERVRKRIMKEDHSWKSSAGKYIEVYRRAVGKNGLMLTK